MYTTHTTSVSCCVIKNRCECIKKFYGPGAHKKAVTFIMEIKDMEGLENNPAASAKEKGAPNSRTYLGQNYL